MSYSNETTNLHLPQWLGSDKPNWDIDTNEAFKKIDDFAGETRDNQSKNTTKFETVDQELEQIRNKANTQQDMIDENVGKLAEHDLRLEEVETHGEKLDTDFQGLGSRVSNLEDSQSADRLELDELDGRVTTNTENILTNTQGIEANKQAIEELKNQGGSNGLGEFMGFFGSLLYNNKKFGSATSKSSGTSNFIAYYGYCLTGFARGTGRYVMAIKRYGGGFEIGIFKDGDTDSTIKYRKYSVDFFGDSSSPYNAEITKITTQDYTHTFTGEDNKETLSNYLVDCVMFHPSLGVQAPMQYYFAAAGSMYKYSGESSSVSERMPWALYVQLLSNTTDTILHLMERPIKWKLTQKDGTEVIIDSDF